MSFLLFLSTCFPVSLQRWSLFFCNKMPINLLSLGWFNAILTLFLIFFQKKNRHGVLDVSNVCCCFLILLYVFSRGFDNCSSHRSSNVALFTLLSDLSWKLFLYSCANYFVQYLNFWMFFFNIFFSFVGRFEQKCGRAVSHRYLRMQITQPPWFVWSIIQRRV